MEMRALLPLVRTSPSPGVLRPVRPITILGDRPGLPLSKMVPITRGEVADFEFKAHLNPGEAGPGTVTVRARVAELSDPTIRVFAEHAEEQLGVVKIAP